MAQVNFARIRFVNIGSWNSVTNYKLNAVVRYGACTYAAKRPNTGVTPPTTNFFGYLTYDNTGNTLGKLFNLYVPVTITYSWGTIQSAEVVVPVWKTVGQSGIIRK